MSIRSMPKASAARNICDAIQEEAQALIGEDLCKGVE